MKKSELKSLLIVDDEQDLCESIHFLFDDAGYQTFMAFDLAGAKKLLVQYKPLYMITDLLLPDGSGLDLIDWVAEQNLSTKVVLISGFIDTHDQTARIERAMAVLRKPIDLEDLLATVEKLSNG